jgi:hypothetical protein
MKIRPVGAERTDSQTDGRAWKQTEEFEERDYFFPLSAL